MSIEITMFTDFELEPRNDDERFITGRAEIYGNEETYDVVKLLDKDGIRIDPLSETFRRVRSELLFSQAVYDTLREECYDAYHAHKKEAN